MHGYNIFNADNMSPSGDPGVMNGQIFIPGCEFFRDMVYVPGYRDFLAIKTDLRCDASMTTQTYKYLNI